MLNVVILMGRLTATPELQHTAAGVPFTTVCLAIDRQYKKAGADRQTDFIYVTIWRQAAEFVCKYFQKGRMIAIHGSVHTNNYTDRNGNQRTSINFVADYISFCGDRAKTTVSSHSEAVTTPNSSTPSASSPQLPTSHEEYTQTRLPEPKPDEDDGMYPIPYDDLPF